MAVPTGPGSETLHSHHFEDVNATAGTNLIVGVQHHIYTVLSIVCFCSALNASGQRLLLWLDAYDLKAGTTGRDFYIAQQTVNALDTFVWDNKFSFNGYEPADQSPNLDAAGQIAVAAQDSAVPQKLTASTEHASTNFQITVTYIDQDWS